MCVMLQLNKQTKAYQNLNLNIESDGIIRKKRSIYMNNNI